MLQISVSRKRKCAVNITLKEKAIIAPSPERFISHAHKLIAHSKEKILRTLLLNKK